MKKDFESVFDKNISIDEYKLDNLLNKNIEINEKEFPAILIDKNDDINKYININNINSNEIVDKQNENIEINETIENDTINETENIADNENNLNDAYTEEENNLYGDLEETVALKDSDLIGIEDIDDFNLKDAIFENKKNNESEEIYKNNSENSNIENNEELNNIEKEFEKSDYDKVKEIDLIEEDNLKKENEILEYNDKEVIVPSIDSIDYIDESNYINESDSEDEIIELSGNELDLITKDNDISEDINYSVSISEMDNEKKNNENEENIIKVSDENMRKDNFLLEEQPIENSSENINDINNNINAEEEEQKRTDYYINKYKKLHEDYIKSIEEENNKIKEDNKQEEIIENKIENIETSKENIAPVIEEEITDKLSAEEEEMYKSYLGEDLNLIEDTGDLIIEEEILEENIENEFPLNNLEITDKLSVEEEEMYKAYLGEDLELIDDIEDSENIAKSLMDEYKKEMLSNKVEISGELSEEEENIVDDILKKNKNQYYEDTIDYDSIILKELNLNEIEEIDENDFNILENFILGKEQEKGIELISINNENILKKNDFNVNNDSKSVDSFDSIDDDELLKVKENTMSEEKELYESEKKNIDLNVKVEEEFSLNKDDNESVLISEQVNKSNSKDDFDGEITQMDLDLAEKLFENEDQLNNEEYSLKHDLLLSESDIGKFRKLFSYFKNIVDKLPQDNLNEFSKTEFYDIYSALFRKFGE
ncbi:hypothetical protein [uncultured Brachyspira sp.]|uniref:hypothetical protein n=1 Tax=uncultured Brachyspira sp. TaxID=221953 RepID=UPI00320B09BD